ncbi:MAG: hypothetical protein L3J46_10565 [Kangiellaceae bacterium]|nr:hypothetical protein [Kangiellaceae bacterium]
MFVFEKYFVNDPNLVPLLEGLGFRPPTVVIKAINGREFVICSSGLRKCYRLIVSRNTIDLREVEDCEELRKDWEKQKPLVLKMFKERIVADKIRRKIIDEIGEDTWRELEELRATVFLRMR